MNRKPGSVLKEYLDLHDKYLDIYDKCVVIMEVGKFYEMYMVDSEGSQDGPDLQKFSTLLNIQLTKQNKKKKVSYANAKQVGIPNIALKKYVTMLIKDGYTVIQVDQITQAPNIEREVTRIHSSGTMDESSDDSNIIVSLYLESFTTMTNKQCIGVGLSAIDCLVNQTYVHQVESSEDGSYSWVDETYRLIHKYKPKEILCHLEDNMTLSREEICQKLSISSDKIHWNHIKDPKFKQISYQNEYYKKLYPDHGSLEPLEYMGFESRELITLSHIYLMEFIHQHTMTHIKRISKPIFKKSEHYLTLTKNSMYQLYIIPIKEHEDETYSSLVSLLNKCNTAMGRRLCKQRLLDPIIDSKVLQQRYDDIDLFKSQNIYDDIRSHLKYIIDLDKIFRKIEIGSCIPSEMYRIYQSIKPLHDIIDIVQSYPFIGQYQEMCQLLPSFRNHLQDIFNIDELEFCNYQNMTTSIFQPGIYPDIDNLIEDIQLCERNLEDISQIIGKMIDSTKPNIVNLIEKEGWHLTVTNKRSQTLITKLTNRRPKVSLPYLNDVYDYHPKKIIESIQKYNKGTKKISLPHIHKISDKLLSNQCKLSKLTESICKDIMKKVDMEYSKPLFQPIIEFISSVDISSCMAHLSDKYTYCCPTIDHKSQESYMDAKQIRHPLVERIQSDDPYVPNDVHIGNEKNGILLFGANACGKSTLMKSIGLTLVMAQAGFYVPCSSFTYAPYTQLFTRILNNDNIFKGQSSFAIEMSELRTIINQCDNRSLVLGDELCSGTETNSAISIVGSGLSLLSENKSSYMFTSHLHQLTNVDPVKDLAKNDLSIQHLKISYDNDKLIYHRKLQEGPGPSSYGLEVCEGMDMGSAFLSMARKIQQELQGGSTNFVNTKQSNYNKEIQMDLCEICKDKGKDNKSLETHHIKEQQDANDHGMINHMNKNDKSNLVPLCKSCHAKVTHGSLEITGRQQTNQGTILKYTYLKSKKPKKCKYNDDQLVTIRSYKDKIQSKQITYKQCRLDLHNQGIDISESTIKKYCFSN